MTEIYNGNIVCLFIHLKYFNSIETCFNISEFEFQRLRILKISKIDNHSLISDFDNLQISKYANVHRPTTLILQS